MAQGTTSSRGPCVLDRVLKKRKREREKRKKDVGVHKREGGGIENAFAKNNVTYV